MRMRPALEDDAELLAQAEYDTSAAQEGLLVAKPYEIPASAFRRKINPTEGASGTSSSNRWRFPRPGTCFIRGAAIADPDRLLEGTGRFARHVKLEPERDVDAAALANLIHTAYLDMRRRVKAG
jgi:hypothetical protein